MPYPVAAARSKMVSSPLSLLPTAIPGLWGWWDAELSTLWESTAKTDLADTESDAVGVIESVAGSAGDLANSDAGARLIYRTNAINGHPAVQGGTGRVLLTGTWAVIPRTTVIAVIRTPGGFGGGNIFDGQLGTRHQLGDRSARLEMFQGVAILNDPSPSPTINTNYILSARFAADATSRIFRNGVPGSQGDAGGHGLQGIVMGANSTLDGEYWLGHWFSIVVYDRILTDPELSRAHQYASLRSGIALG